MNRKLIKRASALVILVVLAGVVIFAWPLVPILTAFAAKGMCSSVFLAFNHSRTGVKELSFPEGKGGLTGLKIQMQ